jgi:hypothetical protein
MMFGLVIHHGALIGGSGSPRRRADLTAGALAGRYSAR